MANGRRGIGHIPQELIAAMAFDGGKIVRDEPIWVLEGHVNGAFIEIQAQQAATRIAANVTRSTEGHRRRPNMANAIDKPDRTAA
jgi:hypothetical protein